MWYTPFAHFKAGRNIESPNCHIIVTKPKPQALNQKNLGFEVRSREES